MNGCCTCGGFGGPRDPVAHGTDGEPHMTDDSTLCKSGVEPQIVRVLRDHADRGVIDGWAYCKCGWFVREHTADAHRRHVAERLTTAGLVVR